MTALTIHRENAKESLPAPKGLCFFRASSILRINEAEKALMTWATFQILYFQQNQRFCCLIIFSKYLVNPSFMPLLGLVFNRLWKRNIFANLLP